MPSRKETDMQTIVALRDAIEAGGVEQYKAMKGLDHILGRGFLSIGDGDIKTLSAKASKNPELYDLKSTKEGAALLDYLNAKIAAYNANPAENYLTGANRIELQHLAQPAHDKAVANIGVKLAAAKEVAVEAPSTTPAPTLEVAASSKSSLTARQQKDLETLVRVRDAIKTGTNAEQHDALHKDLDGMLNGRYEFSTGISLKGEKRERYNLSNNEAGAALLAVVEADIAKLEKGEDIDRAALKDAAKAANKYARANLDTVVISPAVEGDALSKLPESSATTVAPEASATTTTATPAVAPAAVVLKPAQQKQLDALKSAREAIVGGTNEQQHDAVYKTLDGVLGVQGLGVLSPNDLHTGPSMKASDKANYSFRDAPKAPAAIAEIDRQIANLEAGGKFEPKPLKDAVKAAHDQARQNVRDINNGVVAKSAAAVVNEGTGLSTLPSSEVTETPTPVVENGIDYNDPIYAGLTREQIDAVNVPATEDVAVAPSPTVNKTEKVVEVAPAAVVLKPAQQKQLEALKSARDAFVNGTNEQQHDAMYKTLDGVLGAKVLGVFSPNDLHTGPSMKQSDKELYNVGNLPEGKALVSEIDKQIATIETGGKLDAKSLKAVAQDAHDVAKQNVRDTKKAMSTVAQPAEETVSTAVSTTAEAPKAAGAAAPANKDAKAGVVMNLTDADNANLNKLLNGRFDAEDLPALKALAAKLTESGITKIPDFSSLTESQMQHYKVIVEVVTFAEEIKAVTGKDGKINAIERQFLRNDANDILQEAAKLKSSGTEMGDAAVTTPTAAGEVEAKTITK